MGKVIEDVKINTRSLIDVLINAGIINEVFSGGDMNHLHIQRIDGEQVVSFRLEKEISYINLKKMFAK